MSVAQMFASFTAGLVISPALRTSISNRVGRMVRCLNEDFRASSSETANSFYVGSYGRNTAIPSVSDIDVVFVLPVSTYHQFNAYVGNKQSALLQAIRASIRRTYPSSEIAADGQVVSVVFTDNIRVEVLGAFLNDKGGYTFPDANGGGAWRECKPKHELDAFSVRNDVCNGNLVQLGRMARAWRDQNGVAMTGMLIDTLAYQFIDSWAHKDKAFLYFDWLTRDFFAFLGATDPTQEYWLAPGSGSYARKTGSFRTKAREAHQAALEAIVNLSRNELWAAKQKYRSIYGTAFPY